MIFNAFFAATVFTTVATILCYASTAIAAGEVYLLDEQRARSTSKAFADHVRSRRLPRQSSAGATCTADFLLSNDNLRADAPPLYSGCTGNRRDATSKAISAVELTECNSAYTPLARGRLCSKSKCGGTCTNVNSSTTCYNAPGGFGNPYVSYCPGS